MNEYDDPPEAEREDLPYLNDVNVVEMWADFLVEYTGSFRTAAFPIWLAERVEDAHDLSSHADWCADCTDLTYVDDLYSTKGNSVCEGCFDSYALCNECQEYVHQDDINGTLNDEHDVCDWCRDRFFFWCGVCDGYQGNDWDPCHDEDSSAGCCSSPAMSFRVRNDGVGPLANDTRVTVTMPAGVISDVGMGQIADRLRAEARRLHIHPALYNTYLDPTDEHRAAYEKWHDLSYRLVERVGATWQGKRGNFTKRLSQVAYKDYGIRLAPEVMSEVGNIASAHSRAVDFAIETTRDLNLPREDFANEGSCWWSEYAESRCAFKTNGGFGIRSFGQWGVSGRVWVLPLKLTGDATRMARRAGACGDSSCCPPVDTGVERPGLTPTFDTETPDAYVLFNGYGDLEGYTGPRMFAHMVGWTYRKIGFGCDPMYVNSGSGYLIAPEEIAEKYTDGDLMLSVPEHGDLFETEQAEQVNTIESKELAHA